MAAKKPGPVMDFGIEEIQGAVASTSNADDVLDIEPSIDVLQISEDEIPAYMNLVDDDSSGLTPLVASPVMQQVTFEEPVHWCSIAYYEMQKRVGETFHASAPTIFIDGYTSPDNPGRFCLGLIPNINRVPSAELARTNIGRGVRLQYGAGKITAENVGNSLVFVQSVTYNIRHRMRPDHVCKILPGERLVIYDNEAFTDQLAAKVHEGYEAVYEMTKTCTIRMSFVKGFGPQYKRTSVMLTPCWVEIHLNGALKWLDRVLNVIGPPNTKCSSNS